MWKKYTASGELKGKTYKTKKKKTKKTKNRKGDKKQT